MSRSKMGIISLWWEHIRQRHAERFRNDIDHAEIFSLVRDDGRMTSRYTFMVVVSVGIAILGLLLNSPAVIIGAMLISPLMGPIVLLGFALCTIDYSQFKKSLEALLAGTVLALLASFLIVKFSPLTVATPEILARTQPNLFDLMVAILSGLAAGYAVVKNKGAAIVGVAIATALMPPLAVTGFGLASGDMKIASGAFFLFMTNLLAIALSVAFIAKWYGFSTHHSPTYLLWQSAVTVAIFATLSLPLGMTLKQISAEAYFTKSARDIVIEYFDGVEQRINTFNITISDELGMSIDTVVFTNKYDPAAKARISENLNKAFEMPVVLMLDQVVVGQEEHKPEVRVVESALTAPISPVVVRANKQEEMQNRLHQAIYFPVQNIQVDVKGSRAIIYAKATKGLTLALLYQAEGELVERFPDWQIKVVPPLQPLPYLYFATGSAILEDEELLKLSYLSWALRAWDINEIDVVGFASSQGESWRYDNDSLAARRAGFVAEQLRANGMISHVKGEYKAVRQERDERTYGLKSLQRVELRLHRDDAQSALYDFLPAKNAVSN